jgi:hypothetical protein
MCKRVKAADIAVDRHVVLTLKRGKWQRLSGRTRGQLPIQRSRASSFPDIASRRREITVLMLTRALLQAISSSARQRNPARGHTSRTTALAGMER